MSSSHPSHRLRTGNTHDVVVVGARAAGAATAMLLARHDVSTLFIGRGRRRHERPSTHALMRAGALQLSRWGLLDDVVAGGTPPLPRTTLRYGDETVVITVKPSHGIDAMYAPSGALLEARLVQAAIDAGAQMYDGASVTDVVVRDGRVVGVQAVTRDRAELRLGAALVIGADGIGSTIADRAGAGFTRVGQNAGATTYAYWSDLAADGYEWTYRPNACSAVLPTSDGEACVFVSASPRRIGGGGRAVIEAVVAEGSPHLAERLSRATYCRPGRTWRGRRGYLRRAHGPGWALVGNAGSFSDPVSARGLTDALRDAELLARAVIDGLGADAELDVALAHYEAARDRLSIPLFDTVDRIAGHQWDASEIAPLLQQLSSAMADEVEALVALEVEAGQ